MELLLLNEDVSPPEVGRDETDMEASSAAIVAAAVHAMAKRNSSLPTALNFGSCSNE